MKHRYFSSIFSALAFLAVFTLAVSIPGQAWSAAGPKVIHSPIKAPYLPGLRIRLTTKLLPKDQVLLARCYFKAAKDKSYVFVGMTPVAGSVYQAILPAPWFYSGSIQYTFLVVTKKKKVIRSSFFSIKEKKVKGAKLWKKPGKSKEGRLDKAQDYAEKLKKLLEYYKKLGIQTPSYQTPAGVGAVKVGSDTGFRLGKSFFDNILNTPVGAGQKYGLLAKGLYTGGGSFIASNPWLTALLVVGGGTTAVVVGNSGSGGGGGSTPTPPPEPEPTPTPTPTPPAAPKDIAQAVAADFVGMWSFSGTRFSNPASGRVWLGPDGYGSMTWSFPYQSISETVTVSWTWTQATRRLVMHRLSGSGDTLDGVCTGTVLAFQLVGDDNEDPCVYNFVKESN